MSIDDDQQTTASITDDTRVLDLFTDRMQERRRFATYLNEDPPPGTILFFHGDGGNGKSWLLRLLKERYCWRVPRDTWDYLREFADDRAFIEQFDQVEGREPIPSAYLNFADQPRDGRSPREDYYGLLELRRQLGGRSGLRFPLFDTAVLLYLLRGLGRTPEQVRSLFPAEEVDLLGALVGLIGESKAVNIGLAIGKLFDKHIKTRFTLHLQQRKVELADWEELARLDPLRDLPERLPGLLGKDLNAALALPGAPPRAVLCFDTHEFFWGAAPTSDALYFQQDEWLRRLLRGVNLDSHVVAVVAGREPPRWPNAPKASRIESKYLDLQLIGHLDPDDADEYLTKAGVEDAGLRQALVRHALFRYQGQTTAQVHPVFVGL